MLQNKSFVKKTRKGAVVKVVREHYLRDDIPTGSSLDPDCPPDQARLGAGDDTLHYLIIDTNVALHQLDFLEHRAVEDVVVCSTVLEEARARDRTSYDRLRSLTSSSSSSSSGSAGIGIGIGSGSSNQKPRRFFAFANEHHRDTYVGPPRPGESPNDRNDRAVRRVAGFYAAKFPGVEVVLLTDDRGCRAAAAADEELRELGVRALSCREYARERSKDAPELADLVASAAAERRAGEDEEEEEEEGGGGEGKEKRGGGGGRGRGSGSGSGGGGASTSAATAAATALSPRKRARIYSEHRPLSEVAAGLKNGTLWQGCLRVSRFNKKEAWVKVSSSSGGGGGGGGSGGRGNSNNNAFSEILIKGELAMNRAFDGDVVAVRLLPREQWSAPDERIPGGGGGTGGSKEGPAKKAKKSSGDGNDEEEEEEEEEEEDNLDDGARIALADLEADAVDEAAVIAAAAAAAARGGGPGEKTKAEPPATGAVVAVIRRSWRARGYPALLLPPKPGTDAAAALLRESSSTTTTSRPISLLAAPMDRKLPLIRISTRQAPALLGARVVVAVDGWPSDEHHPLGHFKCSLGKAGDKAAETAALLLEHDVKDCEFSDAVLACVPRLPWNVDPERDLRSSPYREDWRERAVVFSVDPPGCRDIDDALHVTRLGPDDPRRRRRKVEEEAGGGEEREEGNGDDEEQQQPGEPEFELGVHIADVSHFVRPSTPLDAEASARGTSTYLVDRRLDMLPKALTVDICSLRAGVDRLAFSCVWTVDADGRAAGPVPPRFFKSVIRSRAALTYAEAQARIDDAHFDEEEEEEREGMEVDGSGGKGSSSSSLDREITRSLRTMFSLTKKMRARRAAAGALELASPEVRFELADDETNDPIDAGMYQIRGANRMVSAIFFLFFSPSSSSFFFFCEESRRKTQKKTFLKKSAGRGDDARRQRPGGRIHPEQVPFGRHAPPPPGAAPTAVRPAPARGLFRWRRARGRDLEAARRLARRGRAELRPLLQQAAPHPRDALHDARCVLRLGNLRVRERTKALRAGCAAVHALHVPDQAVRGEEKKKKRRDFFSLSFFSLCFPSRFFCSSDPTPIFPPRFFPLPHASQVRRRHRPSPPLRRRRGRPSPARSLPRNAGVAEAGAGARAGRRKSQRAPQGRAAGR